MFLGARACPRTRAGSARSAGEEEGDVTPFREPRRAGSPFVSALFLAVFFHAFKESIPLNHSNMVDNMLTAACAASVLWLATTFHGVLLDYSCFRVSWKITVYFLATSLLHAAVFGAVYAQCFAKNGFFHGPCCAKAAAAEAAAAGGGGGGAAGVH